MYWLSKTPEQIKRSAVKNELDKLLKSNYVSVVVVVVCRVSHGFVRIDSFFFLLSRQNHTPTLSFEELTTIRKNLQTIDIEVDADFIRETWHPVYKRHFLNKSRAKVYDCRKAFYMYHQGLESEVGEITNRSINRIESNLFIYSV